MPDQSEKKTREKVWDDEDFTSLPQTKEIADRICVGTYLRGRIFQEFLSEAFHILSPVISPCRKIFPRPSVSPVFNFVQYRFPGKPQKGKRLVRF